MDTTCISYIKWILHVSDISNGYYMYQIYQIDITCIRYIKLILHVSDISNGLY